MKDEYPNFGVGFDGSERFFREIEDSELRRYAMGIAFGFCRIQVLTF